MERKKAWVEGDSARYVTGHTRPVVAGLFMYSGMGMGTYYGADGFTYWCHPSEAHERAVEEGAAYTYVDSFAYYRPTYLGD